MLVQERSLVMSASSNCFATSWTPLAGASFSLGLVASLALAVVPPGAFAFLAAALFFFESLTCGGNDYVTLRYEGTLEKSLIHDEPSHLWFVSQP